MTVSRVRAAGLASILVCGIATNTGRTAFVTVRAQPLADEFSVGATPSALASILFVIKFHDGPVVGGETGGVTSHPSDVALPAPDESWRLAMHMFIKQETAPILAKAINHLAFVIDDPSLMGAYWANARLTQMRIAEAAVLLDSFAELLVDPQTPERWELTAVRVNLKRATLEVVGPTC